MRRNIIILSALGYWFASGVLILTSTGANFLVLLSDILKKFCAHESREERRNIQDTIHSNPKRRSKPPKHKGGDKPNMPITDIEGTKRKAPIYYK